MPDLPIYEDTYFVGLACELATDTCFLEEKVYMWLANPNSITRTVEISLIIKHIFMLAKIDIGLK